SEYPDCSVERAFDSFEAGSKLAGENRDLILINGDMIGLNAMRICETIRSGSNGENKSIIIFTGIVDNIKKESLLKAGADVYIKKPFDIGQISIYLE
ncbi:MAG: response regulator, partial [Spirochaetaceae bacterium]|nr:response regulator [Spirochaetaceae bacterium]